MMGNQKKLLPKANGVQNQNLLPRQSLKNQVLKKATREKSLKSPQNRTVTRKADRNQKSAKKNRRVRQRKRQILVPRPNLVKKRMMMGNQKKLLKKANGDLLPRPSLMNQVPQKENGARKQSPLPSPSPTKQRKNT
jgi:hypothetical protein